MATVPTTGIGYLRHEKGAVLMRLPARETSVSVPKLRFSGFINWNFSGIVINVTLTKVVRIGGPSGTLTITYLATWNQPGSGFVPVTAFKDPSHTMTIGSSFTFDLNGPSFSADHTGLPTTGAFIIQTGTNFAGNYTSPGSTGQIIVSPWQD